MVNAVGVAVFQFSLKLLEEGFGVAVPKHFASGVGGAGDDRDGVLHDAGIVLLSAAADLAAVGMAGVHDLCKALERDREMEVRIVDAYTKE